MTDDSFHVGATETKTKRKRWVNICGDCFAEFADPTAQGSADKLKAHKQTCKRATR